MAPRAAASDLKRSACRTVAKFQLGIAKAKRESERAGDVKTVKSPSRLSTVLPSTERRWTPRGDGRGYMRSVERRRFSRWAPRCFVNADPALLRLRGCRADSEVRLVLSAGNRVGDSRGETFGLMSPAPLWLVKHSPPKVKGCSRAVRRPVARVGSILLGNAKPSRPSADGFTLPSNAFVRLFALDNGDVIGAHVSGSKIKDKHLLTASRFFREILSSLRAQIGRDHASPSKILLDLTTCM